MASYKDYLNLSPAELMDMTDRDFRKMLNQMSSAANKRIDTMHKNPEMVFSPAYKTFQAGGGFRFGTKGIQDRAGLESEYYRISAFLEDVTSTVKGFREYSGGFIEATERFVNLDETTRRNVEEMIAKNGWKLNKRTYNRLFREERERLIHRIINAYYDNRNQSYEDRTRIMRYTLKNNDLFLTDRMGVDEFVELIESKYDDYIQNSVFGDSPRISFDGLEMVYL